MSPGVRRSFWLLLTGCLAATVACGGDDSDGDPDGKLLVFAASSLTDVLEAAGAAFEAENPDTRVTFNFAASSALATQLNEGAPGDVFASADAEQMAVVTGAGNAETPSVFATNRPVVIAPAGESKIRSFEDLARPGLKLVLAAPDVPIGRYAREVLARASAPGSGVRPGFADDVLANLKSNEPNARAVLTRVQLGEADAGIVYQTDAAAASGEVVVIDIPGQHNVTAEYPVAVITRSSKQELAQAFVVFLLSSEGQSILAEFGFGGAAR